MAKGSTASRLVGMAKKGNKAGVDKKKAQGLK